MRAEAKGQPPSPRLWWPTEALREGGRAKGRAKGEGKMLQARFPLLLLGCCLLPISLATHAGHHQDPPPRILIDQPLRAVEYQLGRLSDGELSRVERKDDDVRYRPV